MVQVLGKRFYARHHQGSLENGPEPIANLKPRASKIKQAEDLKLSFCKASTKDICRAGNPIPNWKPVSVVTNWPPICKCMLRNPSTWKDSATKNLYGLDQKETKTFGQQCLLARRLVKVWPQLYHGAGSKWDSHTKMGETLQVARRWTYPSRG